MIPKVVNLKKIKYKEREEKNSHEAYTKCNLEAENDRGRNMEKHIFKKTKNRGKANDMLNLMR